MNILLYGGEEITINKSVEEFIKSIKGNFVKIEGKELYKSNNYYRDEDEYIDYNDWVNVNYIKKMYN